MCVGLNMNCIKMFMGILWKYIKIKIFYDMFFNIVGGLKIDELEICIDLVLVIVFLSSLNEFVVLWIICIMGELSLNGDVRLIDSGVFWVKEVV